MKELKKVQEYVCGLCFDANYANIVLIRKNRPEWQKGKYNGIGGKVEDNEWPIKAMRREFYEETGLTVDDWIPLCELSKDDYIVHMYYSTVHYAHTAISKTDEIVVYQSVERLLAYEKGMFIEGLEWMIPLAIYRSKRSEEKIKIT